MLCATENKDVSSANSFALEEKPVARSLIQIKDNKGPRMNSWGTPTIKSAQLETCSFKTTSCFLSFKKSAKSSSKFLLITFCFNLKIIPSCNPISNAFDVSWNTLLTSYPSSNDS